MSSTALASLTATYTDSEGEEETTEESFENDHPNSNKGSSHSNDSNQIFENKSAPNSVPGSPATIRITSKVARLVSYFDDTLASDNENDGDETMPKHEHIMMTDDNQKAEESEPVEEDGVLIPSEPPGHCSIDLQDKITKLHDKMQTQQLDMNSLIQKRKDFRNPSIYEKLLQFCAINELGTNYPPSVYDPLKWNKESFYEELAKVQKTEMDKREKERKSKVEFVSGNRKDDDAKKRKSKWDQPGGGGNSLSQNIKPAGLVQPSLTTNATGTKSTVISAFGSLPKKPRP